MESNQRAHPRFAVVVDVAVTLKDGETLHCSINDFSIGGLFLKGEVLAELLGDDCQPEVIR